MMKWNLNRKLENNNNIKEKSANEGMLESLLNTFTVPLKRRRQKLRPVLILAIISFVIFELPFPVDDNLLFLHMKVN